MIKNLIEIWYSFATENIPSFSGVKIERSTPEKLKYLEISSYENFKNVEIHENFGNVKFWNKIENQLAEASYDENELYCKIL